MRKSRRQLIKTVGASAIIGLAGCLSGDNSSTPESPTETITQSETTTQPPTSTDQETTTEPDVTTTTSDNREYWGLNVLNELDHDVEASVSVADASETISEFRSPVSASEEVSFANSIPAYDGEETEYTISVQADNREASRTIVVNQSFQGVLVRIQSEQIRIINLEK